MDDIIDRVASWVIEAKEAKQPKSHVCTYTYYDGKTIQTCELKFNNILHFGPFPAMPSEPVEPEGPPYKKAIRDLSDKELLLEWAYWHRKVVSATMWGAALAAAAEFQGSCERVMRLRGIDFPAVEE